MALMKFREPNQVKWVGVRPGHNGTQIIRSQGADNATVELYLVPVGQTFYLCSASLGYRLVVDGYVKLFINDLVPAQWFLCFEDVLLKRLQTLIGRLLKFRQGIRFTYNQLALDCRHGVKSTDGLNKWREDTLIFSDTLCFPVPASGLQI